MFLMIDMIRLGFVGLVMCLIMTLSLSYNTNDEMIQTFINRGKRYKEPSPHPHMGATSSLYILGPRQKTRLFDSR